LDRFDVSGCREQFVGGQLAIEHRHAGGVVVVGAELADFDHGGALNSALADDFLRAREPIACLQLDDAPRQPQGRKALRTGGQACEQAESVTGGRKSIIAVEDV
jgi:hypothetical protein